MEGFLKPYQVEQIKKKYPDIDKWVDNPPAELKLDLAKLDDTEGKFEKVFLKEKTKILLKDKKVQAASRREAAKMVGDNADQICANDGKSYASSRDFPESQCSEQ